MDALRHALYQTLSALAKAIESRDVNTAEHQNRVAAIARVLGQKMGMSAENIDFLRVAATLHDIGKISIPSEILTRPTRLTTEQFGLIKTHVVVGATILDGVDFPWTVSSVILQHHERLDGSGYPQGLKGDAIVPEARVIAIADTIDAMMSNRPYRERQPVEMVVDVLKKGRSKLFDPGLVDICLAELESDAPFRLVLANA